LNSHHYTALYYRYFSFSLPFCSLFVAYLLYIFYTSGKIKKLFTTAVAGVLIVPSALLFITWAGKYNPELKYNHPFVAGRLGPGSRKLEVPQWRDAFLVNALLPVGNKIDYFRNPAATEFTIYRADVAIKIPVIRNDE
jgi:hypothetical protein